MSRIRWWGIAALILGLGLIFTSNYIYGEVAAGREQISQGQSQVDSNRQFFSITPFTAILGDALTSGAQAEIDAGTVTANYYAKIAAWLHILGLLTLIGGAGIIGYSFFAKKT